VINGQYICIKTDPSLSYYSIITDKKSDTSNATCASNSCQIFNKTVCAKDCPVTNLEFKNITKPGYFGTDSTKLVLDIDRSFNADPLIDMSVSEGPPCLFENEVNSNPDKQNYKLMDKHWYQKCSKSGD
jgi:hypothetical protein